MHSCRGIGGEVAQHGASLLYRYVVVIISQHHLSAGFVQAGIEREFSTMLGIVAWRHQGPPGQYVGKRDHVFLGVAATHAQRMQLQNLASEIFIEAAGAVDARDRIRAH